MDGIAKQNGSGRLESVTGIIFLLDDVLFDRQDWFIPAINYAAVKLGMDQDRVALLADQYVSSHGVADAGIYNHILLSCGQSDSVMNIRAFSAWVNRFTPSRGSISLYPGVLDALQLLSSSFELAVLSEGSVDGQKAKLGALEGSGLFKAVQHADEIDGLKSRLPDTRAIGALQRTMRSSTSETLFVACNPRRHFTATLALGYLTVRSMTGEFARLDYEPDARMAHYNISSVARLPALLGKDSQFGDTQLLQMDLSGGIHNKAHA